MVGRECEAERDTQSKIVCVCAYAFVVYIFSWLCIQWALRSPNLITLRLCEYVCVYLLNVVCYFFSSLCLNFWIVAIEICRCVKTFSYLCLSLSLPLSMFINLNVNSNVMKYVFFCRFFWGASYRCMSDLWSIHNFVICWTVVKWAEEILVNCYWLLLLLMCFFPSRVLKLCSVVPNGLLHCKW